ASLRYAGFLRADEQGRNRRFEARGRRARRQDRRLDDRVGRGREGARRRGAVTSRGLVAVRVNATQARAFAAFTEEIGQWWRPNGLFQFTRNKSGVLSIEPGTSGRLIETYDDGTVFVIGEVRVWDPPRRLVVTRRDESFAPTQMTEL